MGCSSSQFRRNDRHVWSSRASRRLGHTGICRASVEVFTHRGKRSGSIVRRRECPAPSICDGSTPLSLCFACLCPQSCRERDGREPQRLTRDSNGHCRSSRNLQQEASQAFPMRAGVCVCVCARSHMLPPSFSGCWL